MTCISEVTDSLSLGQGKVNLVLWYSQCFLMVLPYFEGAKSKSG